MFPEGTTRRLLQEERERERPREERVAQEAPELVSLDVSVGRWGPERPPQPLQGTLQPEEQSARCQRSNTADARQTGPPLSFSMNQQAQRGREERPPLPPEVRFIKRCSCSTERLFREKRQEED